MLDGVRALGVEQEHLSLARARRLQERGADLRDAQALVMGLRERKDAEELAGDPARLHGRRRRDGADVLRPAPRRRRTRGQRAHRVRARERGRDREPSADPLRPERVAAARRAGRPRARARRRRLRGRVGADRRLLGRSHALCDGRPADATGRDAPGRSCATRRRPRSRRRASAPTAQDIDAAQRSIVEAAPDLGACLHGAGHAVGAEIHEPPFLVPGRDAPLAPGTF